MERSAWAIRLARAIFGITIVGYLVREWLQWAERRDWLLLAIGNPGSAYTRHASITRDGELPGAGLVLTLHHPGWVLFIDLEVASHPGSGTIVTGRVPGATPGPDIIEEIT